MTARTLEIIDAESVGRALAKLPKNAADYTHAHLPDRRMEKDVASIAASSHIFECRVRRNSRAAFAIRNKADNKEQDDPVDRAPRGLPRLMVNSMQP